jgi:hypothetical protein
MNDETDCLEILAMRYPNTPFLALGQTVLWDEPTKTTLFLRGSRRPFVAGVHDTDYFAKLPGHPATAGEHPFALVAHDDVTTRGLWSAAGEMSRLFGSEDVPTRELLQKKGGVQWTRLTADEQQMFTTAWGWTGIIQAGWEKSIVAEERLAEVLPTLLQQVRETVGGSAEHLSGTRAEGAMALCATLCGWITDFATAHPDATLPDLYEDLLPRLWALLLGAVPPQLTTTRTTRLLRFNTQTAGLPRFALVEVFLNPKTRKAASDAYNAAVEGSDIYTLDEFGVGALPFDVFVPGKGRGTLHVTPGGTVTIDAAETITLRGKPIVTLHDLAERLETLSTDCVLLGKAVTLIPMLATEFILTMHEGASAYTDRTRALVQQLPVKHLHPILRLRYDTWTALSAIPPAPDTHFVLPPHLQQATGRTKIDFDDFAACWRTRILDEKQTLCDLRTARKPRDLFVLLNLPATAYEEATQTLLTLRAEASALHQRVHALYAQIDAWRTERQQLERAKGDDFRARALPLTQNDEQERQVRFDLPIDALRQKIRAAREESRRLKSERRAIETSTAAQDARATLRACEATAERERARRAQNALQTVHGLPHTAYRPSAWWFPLVDPSGAWLQRTAETATLFLEELA